MHTEINGHCTRAGYAIWSLEILSDIQDGKESAHGIRDAIEYMWAATTPERYASEIEACERGS